jgi:Mn2+/Fe2+ NRAMP family transporter
MLITRLLSLVPCIVIVQFIDLEKANVVLNIIQFVQLPFIIIPAIRFISNTDLVQAEAYVGSKLYILLGVSGSLIVMNLYQVSSNLPDSTVGKVITFFAMILYVAFMVYIARCRLSPISHGLRQIPNGSSLRSDSFAC